MIIFNVSDVGTISSVQTESIIQNSYRVNKIFIAYENALTRNHQCRLTFERADGSKIEDLATYVGTGMVNGTLKEGFNFTFPSRALTEQSGNLKVGIKIFDLDSSGNVSTIKATATFTLTVTASVVPNSEVVYITATQYQALNQAINDSRCITKLPICVDDNHTINQVLTYIGTYLDTVGIYATSNLATFILYTNIGDEYCYVFDNDADVTGVYIYEDVSTYTKVSDSSRVIGILSSLTTTNKSNLVAAINELKSCKAELTESNTFTGTNTFNGDIIIGKSVTGGVDSITARSVDGVIVYKDSRTDKTAKKMTYAQFVKLIGQWIGDANSESWGFMSSTDKTRLDTLYALLGSTADADSVVNTINEVLAIFNNYPEGATLVQALASKVDKTAYDTKIASLDADIERIGHANIDTSKDFEWTGEHVFTREIYSQGIECNYARVDAIYGLDSSVDIIFDNVNDDLIFKKYSYNSDDETTTTIKEFSIFDLESRVTSLENEVIKEVEINGTKHTIATSNENLMPYAVIKKLGGMSYKSKNLFKYTSVASTRGCEVTAGADGQTFIVHISDAYDPYVVFNDFTTMGIPKGTYYIRAFANKNIRIDYWDNGKSYYDTISNEAKQITIDDNSNYVHLEFEYNGEEVTDFRFKLMLSKTPITEFTPSYADLKHNKITSVKVTGKNLFDGKLENGFINISNGNNVESSDYTRPKNFMSVKPNTSYYISASGFSTFVIILYDINKNYIGFESSNVPYGFTTNANTRYIKFYCDKHLDKNIMISQGTQATTYQPYHAKEYLKDILDKINDKVEEDDYELGIGINSNCYNYIDFDNSKVVIKCKKVDYTSGDENNSNYLTDGSTETIKPLSSTYEIDISDIISSELFIRLDNSIELLDSNDSIFDNDVPFGYYYQKKGE